MMSLLLGVFVTRTVLRYQKLDSEEALPALCSGALVLPLVT